MSLRVADILVVGGGINGCAIARDAAGRGLSVIVCEKDDLASGTSSASTKLIHGGLRYLEHYELGLVRKALAEREVLMRMAPHLVQPLRFVLPVSAQTRPAWLIRLGLFLYDRLGGNRTLPGTSAIRLDQAPLREVMQPAYRRGYEYSDCRVDDARLVVLNALDAHLRKATILTRTRFLGCIRRADHWQATLQCTDERRHLRIRARVIVDASGSWDIRVGEQDDRRPATRLVKGSHIVVPRLYEHDRAYLLQNSDARIVFTIPYESRFTLVGTTDVEFHGDPDEVCIDNQEIEYLCLAVNRYFCKALSSHDVVHSFAGVRALSADEACSPEDASRDYAIELTSSPGPCHLRITGGKITTARILAEDAVGRLAGSFPRMGPPWTKNSRLPGGDFEHQAFEAEVARICAAYPFLHTHYVARLMRLYGTRCRRILADVRSPEDLGQHLGGGLHIRELTYLLDNEWARTSEDVLWRRTKLGLTLSRDDQQRLKELIERHRMHAHTGDERRTSASDLPQNA